MGGSAGEHPGSAGSTVAGGGSSGAGRSNGSAGSAGRNEHAGGGGTGAAAGGTGDAAGRPTSGDAGSGADVGNGGANDAGNGGSGPALPTYEETVLADEPLVYWRMAIDGGVVVPDETGGGNDLVLQGSGHHFGVSGAIAGDSDPALGFDGAGSFAVASDARALDFADGAAFTLEGWARRVNGGESYFQYLFANVQGTAGSRNGYLLYLLPEPASDDGRRATFEYDQPGNELGISAGLPAEGEWAHYAATFAAGVASIYVNGTLADSSPIDGSIATRTAAFSVGRSSDANDSFFKGDLDELAVYPRALPLKTIARHAAFGR
jgi:hypothetical protein